MQPSAVQGGNWWIAFSVGRWRLAMAKTRSACLKQPSAECRPETWESFKWSCFMKGYVSAGAATLQEDFLEAV